jgi:hypothetical protein
MIGALCGWPASPPIAVALVPTAGYWRRVREEARQRRCEHTICPGTDI